MTAKEFYDAHYSDDTVVIMRDYAKMLTDRMYSEEEVLELLNEYNEYLFTFIDRDEVGIGTEKDAKRIFEQFKKK